MKTTFMEIVRDFSNNINDLVVTLNKETGKDISFVNDSIVSMIIDINDEESISSLILDHFDNNDLITLKVIPVTNANGEMIEINAVAFMFIEKNIERMAMNLSNIDILYKIAEYETRMIFGMVDVLGELCVGKPDDWVDEFFEEYNNQLLDKERSTDRSDCYKSYVDRLFDIKYFAMISQRAGMTKDDVLTYYKNWDMLCFNPTVFENNNNRLEISY